MFSPCPPVRQNQQPAPPSAAASSQPALGGILGAVGNQAMQALGMGGSAMGGLVEALGGGRAVEAIGSSLAGGGNQAMQSPARGTHRASPDMQILLGLIMSEVLTSVRAGTNETMRGLGRLWHSLASSF